MITSYSTSKDEATGIIHICVNTEEKWPGYTLNRKMEGGKVFISFDDDYADEFVEIEGFNPFKYQLFSSQEKDQIYIVCIPFGFIHHMTRIHNSNPLHPANPLTGETTTKNSQQR